jgi:phage FluMu protein Com
MEPKGSSGAVRCPQCGKLSRLPAGISVTRVRCPHCHAVWQLAPRGEPSPAPNLGSQAGGIPDDSVATGAPGTDGPDFGQQPLHLASRGPFAEDKHTKAPPHIWWFVLGGLFVFALVVIVGLVIAVVFLAWQRPAPAPQPVAPPQQVVAPPQPPPQPQMDQDLVRRGEATAAYLQGLLDATGKALVGSDLASILIGGAGIQNPGEKLAAWEREVASLNPQDVDPLAIEFKEEFAQKFRNLMRALEAGPKLAFDIASAPSDKMLDKAAGQLTPLAFVAPLQDFINFVTTRGAEVKAELEKRYNREMPVLRIPSLGGGSQVP